MKILYIAHERKMGGANHSLVELVNGLRELGNDVSVIVLYRGCPIDKKLKKMGIKTFPCFFGWWQQPKEWSCVQKRLFRLMHWFQKISVMRLSQYVKKNGIDIIHSNSSVIDIGAQVATKTGCKHVWHFREYGDADYNLEYMFGKEASLNYVYQNSDMVIFISKTLYEFYKQFTIDEKTRIIYDGIVPRKIEENLPVPLAGKRKEDHIFTFLVTGNISSGKNQKLVVEADNVLIHQMKVDKRRFQIYFAGTTTSLTKSKKYMQEIQLYISQHDLDNLFFVGYIKDMNSLREMVDAEIVPSRSEAYGRVTLEAMLSYNLVIASNSGANSELIGENEFGLLFKNNDIHDLAIKMLQALEGDGEEYKERAYRYVKKMHREDVAYRSVQDIYRHILEKE